MSNYRGIRSRGQYREYGRCQINSSRTYSSARQSIDQSTRSFLPSYTRGKPQFDNASPKLGASLGDALVQLKSAADFYIGVANLRAINNVVSKVFYSLLPGQTAYLTISFGGGTASLISNSPSPGFPSSSPSVINVSVTAPEVIIKPPIPAPQPPSTNSVKKPDKPNSGKSRSSRRGSEGYGADAREAMRSSGGARESHSSPPGETNPRGGGETNPRSGGDTHSPGGLNPGNGGSGNSPSNESPGSDISSGGLG